MNMFFELSVFCELGMVRSFNVGGESLHKLRRDLAVSFRIILYHLRCFGINSLYIFRKPKWTEAVYVIFLRGCHR